MKKAIVISVISSFVLGVAYAGQNQESLAQSKLLSFEELKESCTNPERFHNQMPPKDIKIRCEDYRTVWVPLEQKNFAMKAQRSVKTSLISDKYHVTDSTNEIPLQSTQGSCPVFQEMNQALNTQKKVSCEEILAHQGNLLEFCLQDIDKTFAENAEVVNEKATGKIFTTCKGQIVQQGEESLKGFGMEQQDSLTQGQGIAQTDDKDEPVKEDSAQGEELQDQGQEQGKLVQKD